MYANVVVGIDGRDGGRDASALVAMLAAADAFVSLVHVSTTVPIANHASNLDLNFADERSLRLLMDRELELCGGDARLERVPAPSVGEGLEEVARRSGADLIIVGASRRHGITRLITGDDVRSLMHHTQCAVAVAPAGYAEDLRLPVRIGVAFDGSPESEVALAHAGMLAARRRSLLNVRHAVEPQHFSAGWGMTAALADDLESELAAAHERLPSVDGIEVEHVYGPVCEALVEFAEEVDLIVCGSRRNHAVKRIAQGSTSEYLVRHADVPVLVAPPADTASLARWREHQQTAGVC
jgi:nucleotide-binding universal stress UspA family protein